MNRKTLVYLSLIALALSLGTVARAQRAVPAGNGCGESVSNKPFVDWAQFQFDACHTGYNSFEAILGTGNVGNLVLAWDYEAFIDEISSSPTIANGVLYFGTSEYSEIYALDARTGDRLWGASTSYGSVGTPAVAYGNVYVAVSTGSSGRIFAFNANGGSPLWNGGDGDIPSAVTVADDAVYVASSHQGLQQYSGLYALNSTTGGFVWQYHVPDWGFGGMPSVANGTVYVECDLGFCAFDAATGMLKWNYSSPEGFYFFTASVSNGVVYAGAALDVYNGRLVSLGAVYALDAATGTLLWQSPIAGTLGPADNLIYPGTPAVANGVVYLGTYKPEDKNFGCLYAIDAHSGAHLWQFKTGGSVSSPAVANGVVYFGSGDGNLYALDAKTGIPLWKYTSGERYFSSPAVVNGMLYVATVDWEGHIYAFHLPEQ
jgi:outer membrane protein assembly factor BamB